MTTRTDGPSQHADNSEKAGFFSGNLEFESFAALELQQFKSVLGSYVGAAKLPDFFPKFEITESASKVSDTAKPTDSALEARKRLYGVHEKAIDAVKPEACTQPSNIGNCYFVAAMASLAKVNPQAIVDMINVNENGSYTVRFPGASKPVTVGKPSAAELEQVGGATKFGDWPVVMMKAYGKYCGGGKSDIDGSDGGSLFSAGVKVLTDKGVVNYGIGYMIPLQSWKSLDSELNSALNSKEALPVTVSTAKSLFSDATKDGFARQHVYSVLEYKHNPNDIKQSTVVVRNPWGGANASKEITLQQFSDNFLQLSIPRR